MSLIGLAALIALAALVLWTVGAPLARFGGVLMMVTALASIALGGPILDRLGLLTVGAALWLVGHMFTAFKAGAWRSRAAHTLIARTPLRVLDPVAVRTGRRRRGQRSTPANAEKKTRRDETAPIDHFAEWENEMTTSREPATTAGAPVHHAPSRSSRPSRGAVYGKRAAKVASRYAVKKVPGARAARSVYRFLR